MSTKLLWKERVSFASFDLEHHAQQGCSHHLVESEVNRAYRHGSKSADLKHVGSSFPWSIEWEWVVATINCIVTHVCCDIPLEVQTRLCESMLRWRSDSGDGPCWTPTRLT